MSFKISPVWKVYKPTDYQILLLAGLNPKKAERCSIIPYLEADSGKFVNAYCIVHKKSAEKEMPGFREMINEDPYSFVREMEDNPRIRIKKIQNAPFPISVAFRKKPEMDQLPARYHGYTISSLEKEFPIEEGD